MYYLSWVSFEIDIISVQNRRKVVLLLSSRNKLYILIVQAAGDGSGWLLSWLCLYCNFCVLVTPGASWVSYLFLYCCRWLLTTVFCLIGAMLMLLDCFSVEDIKEVFVGLGLQVVRLVKFWEIQRLWIAYISWNIFLRKKQLIQGSPGERCKIFVCN